MAEKLGKVPEGQGLGRGVVELTSSEGTWTGKPSKRGEGLSSTGSLDRRTGMSSIQEYESTRRSCFLGIRTIVWASLLQCQRGRCGVNLRTQS